MTVDEIKQFIREAIERGQAAAREGRNNPAIGYWNDAYAALLDEIEKREKAEASTPGSVTDQIYHELWERRNRFFVAITTDAHKYSSNTITWYSAKMEGIEEAMGVVSRLTGRETSF